MSYDLYFKARDQKSTLSVDGFVAYFKRRSNYEVTDQQAIYQNQITGVYFVFDFGKIKTDEQNRRLPVAFNLNYYRPHIFGLEAEPEIQSFVREFNLLVIDDQLGGMGEGEYSSLGFLNGWNRGNEFAYQAFLQQKPESVPPSLSTSQIEECWRWNLAQPGIQQKYGEDVFVPRYMFTLRDGKVNRTVVWPDAIPTALPEADVYLIIRKTVLPKKFFFPVKEDKVFASGNDLKSVLEQFPVEPSAVPYRLLRYSNPPDSIISLIRRLKPTDEKPVGVTVDKILNLEIIEKFKRK